MICPEEMEQVPKEKDPEPAAAWEAAEEAPEEADAEVPEAIAYARAVGKRLHMKWEPPAPRLPVRSAEPP